MIRRIAVVPLASSRPCTLRARPLIRPCPAVVVSSNNDCAASVRNFAAKPPAKTRDVVPPRARDPWGDVWPETVWDTWDQVNDFLSPVRSALRRVNRDWRDMAREMDAYVPSIDLSETPEAYKVEAEIPGLKKEDIKIEFDNNVLTIKGERKTEHSEKREQKEGGPDYHRVERWYGRFQRSWQFLEGTINKDAIGASYKDGILTVTLPKAQPKQPSTIEIQIEDQK